MPTSYSRIKTVWQFAKRYVPFFIVAEICILVSYGAAVILPLNLSQLTDRVLIEGQHDMFVSVLLQFVLLFAISSAFNFIYAYTWQTLQNRYIVDVKNEIFRKTIFAKASFLSNMSSGDIMSRIDCDAEQFLHVIQRNLFHFVNSIIMCLSIVTIVGAIHIWLAVLLVVMATLPILLTRLCTKATEKYARETREITGNMTGRFYEILKGWREIHLHGAEEWAKSQMMTPFRRLIVLGNRLRRINFFVDKGIYFINLMTSLVIYGVSAVLIFQGQMTVGLFMAVIQYIALMHRKFNWMLRIYLDWYTRKSSIDRVHEILAADTEDDEGLEQITYIESIEFRQVSFAYEPQTPILQDVTFAINKGEHVGIAGASGAGKSSLLGLIMGFYQPSSGEIRINGIPQTKISPFAIRRLVGMVSQDIFVFRETIRYNLELGASYSEDELWAALKAVQLQEMIGCFGLEARVVERKRHYVVYLKEGSGIVDILNVMEAHVALMQLENVRIVKEMRNSINRRVNCETANITKTVSAAVRQIDDIRLIDEVLGLHTLPDALRDIAEVRLQNPDAPLHVLGNMLTPPVGKSGVNHRLRKLSQMAEEIRENKEEQGNYEKAGSNA